MNSTNCCLRITFAPMCTIWLISNSEFSFKSSRVLYWHWLNSQHVFLLFYIVLKDHVRIICGICVCVCVYNSFLFYACFAFCVFFSLAAVRWKTHFLLFTVSRVVVLYFVLFFFWFDSVRVPLLLAYPALSLHVLLCSSARKRQQNTSVSLRRFGHAY